MKNVKFSNQDCVIIENNNIEVTISHSIGPRILAINFHGKRNLLAELPDFTTQLPDGNPYHFYGGHRLWMAPEQVPLTYEYDDQPVKIVEDGDSVLIKKDIEKNSGIEKTIRLKLDPYKALVSVEHALKNCGNQPLECAPWAITQFRTGGVAILPQNRTDTGFLPNRSVAIWPYTDMNDPIVKWGNGFILLNAKVASPFKVGFPNPRGWLAYWLDGSLFVKRAPFDTQAHYCDMGSSSECYCNDQFLELETLGPKTVLAPGDAASHNEIWELFEDIDKPENELQVKKMIEKLNVQ